MIRVIERWRIRHGMDEKFRAAWERAAKAVKASVDGARGTMLLQSGDDPTEYIAFGRWESLEQWNNFRRGAHPDPGAADQVKKWAGDPFRTEVYWDVLDLSHWRPGRD